MAQDTAQATRYHLDRALSAVYAVAALVQQTQGSVRDFDRVAGQIRTNYPGASILILAPGGIISHAVPLAGNEAAIGLNLLRDPVMRAETERARNTGRLTLAGPLPLRQGGDGLVARLPIFLDSPAPQPGFWGFANAVLRLPDALSSVPTDHFARAGLDYAIWRVQPETGQPQPIAGVAMQSLQNPVRVSFEVPNGVWNLAAAPRAGWQSGHHRWTQGAWVLLWSLALGALTLLQVRLLASRGLLERQVQARTVGLSAAQAQLSATLDAIPDALLEMDASGVILSARAPAGHALDSWFKGALNRPAQAVWGQDAAADLCHTLRLALNAGHSQGTQLPVHLLGASYWVELSVARKGSQTGDPAHLIVIAHDITARKLAEEHVAQLAYHDALTGLPNRALFNDRLAQALSECARRNEHLSVVFVDLDHFKNVNDTLGHAVGDRLLQAVAQRLRSTVREQDTVARLGGDEFVLVLPDTGTRGSARVGHKLLQALNAAIVLDGHELAITPSVGVAIYPEDGTDAETLAQHADAAMYQAKHDGRNTVRYYTDHMQADAARTLLIDNELRRALARRQLQLHYQPQMALGSGAMVGVEALLRWQHPDLGWVSPAEFIPIAETSGQILAIGEWVLHEALRQMRAWQLAGLPQITVAVNLSAVQFRQPNLVAMVHHALATQQIEPRWLELELTESVAHQEPERAAAVMAELAEMGVQLAIDDFGTGYSSLSYLKRFAVHQLKIDQSFVRDITDDPDDLAIVRAIIGLAQHLGLSTLAEGVETQAQLALLQRLGCDQVQGYLYSRPVSADALATLLRGDTRLTPTA